MKKAILFLAVAILVAGAMHAQGDEETLNKASYGIGYQTGMNFAQQGVELDLEQLIQGLKDGMSGAELRYSPEELQVAMGALQSMVQQQRDAVAAEAATAAQTFLEENAKRDSVVTLESGLQYEVVTEGDGPIPQSTDRVRVHYEGKLVDGTVFDSSYERGEPVVFPVTGVISGWVEALQLMKVGSKWKLYIPADLAYGENGQGPIPPNSALIFDVELLGIE